MLAGGKAARGSTPFGIIVNSSVLAAGTISCEAGVMLNLSSPMLNVAIGASAGSS